MSISRSILLILILLASMGLQAQSDLGDVVLVSAASGRIPSFSIKEIRMLFLGLPISKNEQKYTPVINITEDTLYDKFLQKIMFMSANNYDRQLVSIVFRKGGERPRKIRSKGQLITHLIDNPGTVTFIPESDASRSGKLQIIQKLW